MKPSKKWSWYAVLFFLGIIALAVDNAITDNLQTIKNPVLDFLFYILLSPAALVVVFFAAIFSLIFLKRNKQLFQFFKAFLVGFFVSHILKLIIQRPRPLGLEKHLFVINFPDYSFPSSHAVVAFAILPFMINAYPKYRWPFIILACLIALSRVYAGVHYLSDIVFGALIGLTISAFIIKSEKNI